MQDKNTFTWQTTFEDSGEYNILIAITDGELSDSKPVNVKVNNANRAPSLEQIADITDETLPVIIAAIATDPDKQLLTYQIKQHKIYSNRTIFFTWQTTFEDSGEYNLLIETELPGDLADSKTLK